VEKLFETGRKASAKKAPGNKTPGGRLSWALRFLRLLFNLALILVVGVLVVSGHETYLLRRGGSPTIWVRVRSPRR
jgi:hypothetical protein